MAYDWVDDESLSAEETMRRFRALGPERTHAPKGRENVSRQQSSGPRRITSDNTTRATKAGRVRVDRDLSGRVFKSGRFAKKSQSS